ncbi:MAG: hypothetical protein BHW63_00510 [Mycoplasma sp. CAG:611_25_7]|nr:MAG: hypothetical protein BHW63_00510 [Mycoplasma sp. CAG:611_25_7]
MNIKTINQNTQAYNQYKDSNQVNHSEDNLIETYALQVASVLHKTGKGSFTIDEIKDIIDLVDKTRHIYMMGETCYYYPCAIFCREKYKTGEMGKFVYGESQYYHDICEMYSAFSRSGGSNWRRVAGIPPMYYNIC